jgi:tight adherence protein B
VAEPVLVIASIALLLAAAGLVLWQWAAGRQARQAAGRHLERQIRSDAGREEPAFDPRRGSGAETEAAAPSPWHDAVEPPATRKTGLAAVALPGFLHNVVTVQVLAALMLAEGVLCVCIGLLANVFSAACVLVLAVLLTAFWLWLRVQRFRSKLASQLPPFIDAMVRLIAIGNSTHAAFQLSIPSTQAPLRAYLEGASSLVRAGAELDQALQQMARNVRIEEMYLLAAILGLGVRYGGRSDVLLERVSHFMRDREQAQRELVAMSAETRLSAWVLGLLPAIVGLAIVMLNAAYFARLWNDPSGKMMIFSAIGLQALGALLLYRLARLA